MWGRLQRSIQAPVGGEVFPADVATLAYWVRADRGITLAGTQVAAWNDQGASGDAGRHATQLTVNSQPLYVYTNSLYNGRPTIRFDGGDGLRTSAWSVEQVQPMTWFVVGHVSAGGAAFFMDGIVSNKRHALFANGSAGAALSYFAGTQRSSAYSAGVPSVMCMVVNGASSSLYANALTAVNGPGNLGVQGFTGLSIGSVWDNTNRLTGDIAEIVGVAGAMATTPRNAMMNLLATRYGITLGA